MAPAGTSAAGKRSAMLVVSANWGFSDGTLAATPSRATMARFRAEVRRAAARGGFRRDGRYEPVDGVDLVLAGDTFDWLFSREWSGDERPWHGGPRGRAAWARVVTGALRRAAWLGGTLARWSRRGIEVPLADRRSRPLVGACRRVPVRVTLLGGDRDRGVDGVAGTAVATTLARRGIAVGSCWSNGMATVRHGAEVDPLAAEDADADGPALGDSIAVDVVVGFGVAVAGTVLPGDAATDLVGRLARGRVIDAPLTLARWLAAATQTAHASGRGLERVRDEWNRRVAGWHRAARRLTPRGGRGCDLLDPLAAWLALGDDAVDREAADRFAAGVAPEPPAILVAGDRGVPTPATPLVVLGHPSACAAAWPAWRGRVICLGPGAAGRRTAVPEGVTVVVPGGGNAADAADVEWLPTDASWPTMDSDRIGPVASAVWRSDAAARPRVLDAA